MNAHVHAQVSAAERRMRDAVMNVIGLFGLLLLVAGIAACGYAIVIPVVTPGTTTIDIALAFQNLAIAVVGAAVLAAGWLLLLGGEILSRLRRNQQALEERLEKIVHGVAVTSRANDERLENIAHNVAVASSALERIAAQPQAELPLPPEEPPPEPRSPNLWPR